MIKHVFIGFLHGMNETDVLRWYLRYHSKEVPRFVGPWLRRYETFKPYAPPPEAKKFGALGGFYTELWYSSVEDFAEARANYRPYTAPDWGLASQPMARCPLCLPCPLRTSCARSQPLKKGISCGGCACSSTQTAFL